jgi:uncharacterized protein YdeI (YjbR/CyaY-like superfamily)
MGKKDPRVDSYLSNSADFAKPILTHLRQLVHRACPEVEETIKWGSPFFMYHGMLCNMASFKQHCAFGFWQPELRSEFGQSESAGQLGRITSVKDLPKDSDMVRYIKEAAKANEAKEKSPAKAKPKEEKKPLKIPAYFTAALKKNKKALTSFGKFSYSKQKEYVDWLDGAKTDATREKRLETALEWIAEGKERNWKYARK